MVDTVVGVEEEVRVEETEAAAPYWTAWRFHSRENLVEALEQYASFRGEPGVHQYGLMYGGDEDKAAKAHERVMKQNAVIDRAMARLRHIHSLSHRLLDAYYRSGLCYQSSGWRTAFNRTSLSYHCQTRREHERHERDFDELLQQAIDALWAVYCMRSTLKA